MDKQASPDVPHAGRITQKRGHQRARAPIHKYSSASLTLEWGEAAYCRRLLLLGHMASEEETKRLKSQRLDLGSRQ